MHQPFTAATMANQLGNRDHLQMQPLRQFGQFRPTGPIARGVEDLAQHAGGVQSGQPRQIDGRLRVACPPQHAAFLGHQRQDVTRSDEIPRLSLRADQFPDRATTLAGRNPGPHRLVIDRDGVGRPVRVARITDHQGQVEPFGDLRQDGRAEQPLAVADEEVDQFGCDLLRRADEVSLVFPILRIHHDHGSALSDGVHRCFDGRKRLRHHMQALGRGHETATPCRCDRQRVL